MTAPETDGTDLRPLRCPFCLGTSGTTHRVHAKKKISCPRCERAFRVCDALPPSGTQPERLLAAPSGARGWGKLGRMTFLVTFVLVALIGVVIATSTVHGPPFLAIYVLLGVVTFAGGTYVRLNVSDEWLVSIVPFFVYEGVGLVRILGSPSDMKSFGILILLMAFGAVVFFVRPGSPVSGSGFHAGCGGGGGGCGGGCGGCSG